MIDGFNGALGAQSSSVSHTEVLSQPIKMPESAPTLLLMAGFAGAGKTTLAEWLEKHLHWKLLNKDIYKKNHLQAGESLESASWKAFDDLFANIQKEVIDRQLPVIVDTSNEYPFIIENIKEIVEQMEQCRLQSCWKIILCVANKETRLRRLRKRGSEFKPFITTLPTVLEDSELNTRFQHLLGGTSLPDGLADEGNTSIVDIHEGVAINTTTSIDVYGKLVLERLKLVNTQVGLF